MRAARVMGLCLAGSFGGVALVVACGARTGLEVLQPADAAHDAGHDVAPDVTPDVTPESPFDAPPIHEAHPLDVMPECTGPTYCVAGDPNHIYKCGIPVFVCDSLQQCVEPCGDAAPGDACAAECRNPCLYTLGENTSNGCEFYAVEMDQTPQSTGVCYAVFVVNQWQTGQNALLKVDLGGKALPVEQFARIPSGHGPGIVYAPFDSTKGLAQNQIAILFLSRDPSVIMEGSVNPSTLANCPPGVVPAVVGDAALHGTGIGTAFHITSNVPIVAYQMLPYGGGHARVTGATLLLPTNVWGTNYVAANAYAAASALIPCNDGGVCAGPTMAVVAQQDATHVTINPVAGIDPGGGLPGADAGTPVTYTLDKGQYLQFTQLAELTGSPIQADAPVAVLGGSTLIDLPISLFRADHAEQMLPPVQSLGSEYVAVRYRSRKPGTNESVPWRLVGVVDGTKLSYDPAAPMGAPTTLNHGQIVEIDDPGPWVVSSQDSSHPFYFAQYMTGGSTVDTDAGFTDAGDFASIYNGAGDPEFVNVISPSQYLPGYTFFTDPTYPETNLVVVSVFDALTKQFPTVTLECAGALTGWQPLGTKGRYQFTRVDLSTGNFVGQNGCDNGVHTIAATLGSDAAPPGEAARIGVTIWGWGSGATYNGRDDTNPNNTRWVSYAYPAGANIAKLNSVVFPAK